MPRREEFSVELDGAPVRTVLTLPGEGAEDAAVAAVLLCHGLPALGAEAAELCARITDALVDAGLAVAAMTGGSAGAPGARLAVESVDDAAAVFHGLALRDELDLKRLCVLGYSLGGIVASCLARRTDQVRRLALLAPATPDDVSARLAGGSEDDLAAHLGGAEVPPGFFDGMDALTPAEDLAARDRPTLIVHGAADRVMPPTASLAYRDAVVAAGHRVEHVLVALGDHVFSNALARAACVDQLTRFFTAGGESDGDAGRA